MDIDLSTIEVMNAEAADSGRGADGTADCGQARLLGAGWTSALRLLGVCFYLDSTKHLFKVTGDWRNNTDKIVECFIDI